MGYINTSSIFLLGVCSFSGTAAIERASEVAAYRSGKPQTVETLINEEALLLAKFLRDERKTWIPRIKFGERATV